MTDENDGHRFRRLADPRSSLQIVRSLPDYEYGRFPGSHTNTGAPSGIEWRGIISPIQVQAHKQVRHKGHCELSLATMRVTLRVAFSAFSVQPAAMLITLCTVIPFS